MTKPEQSNPDGEAPPHLYGTPRYCSAIPTTPPCVWGGGLDAGGPEEDGGELDGGGLGAGLDCPPEWLVCALAARARAAAARRAWRARSSACSFAISPL